MSRIDPFELLRRLNPIRHEEYTDADEQLLSRILAMPIPSRRRSPRRLWIAGGVGVAVLATAAWGVLRTEEPTDPTGIACHADLAPAAQIVALGPADDPVAACADAWRTGLFGNEPVPPSLHGCVSSTGLAAVYPGGSEVCSRLGLAQLQPIEEPDTQRIVRLQELAAQTFGFGDCIDESSAVAIAQGLIDEVGLEDWTVKQVSNYGADRPCTASGVDVESKTLNVGGRSRPSTQP